MISESLIGLEGEESEEEDVHPFHCFDCIKSEGKTQHFATKGEFDTHNAILHPYTVPPSLDGVLQEVTTTTTTEKEK
jgi:hypothetical protein